MTDYARGYEDGARATREVDIRVLRDQNETETDYAADALAALPLPTPAAGAAVEPTLELYAVLEPFTGTADAPRAAKAVLAFLKPQPSARGQGWQPSTGNPLPQERGQERKREGLRRQSGPAKEPVSTEQPGIGKTSPRASFESGAAHRAEAERAVVEAAKNVKTWWTKDGREWCIDCGTSKESIIGHQTGCTVEPLLKALAALRAAAPEGRQGA